MKLKKFLRKFVLNSKDIKISYFENNYYQIKDLNDVYTNHKELLDKKIHHLNLLDNNLYICIENN